MFLDPKVILFWYEKNSQTKGHKLFFGGKKTSSVPKPEKEIVISVLTDNQPSLNSLLNKSHGRPFCGLQQPVSAAALLYIHQEKEERVTTDRPFVRGSVTS